MALSQKQSMPYQWHRLLHQSLNELSTSCLLYTSFHGNTTGSLSNTGEVTAELFRLGVPLANGEMIQYHPTTVKCGGKRMLISEAARGEGGRLFAMKDGKQWYFMEEKYPELDVYKRQNGICGTERVCRSVRLL